MKFDPAIDLKSEYYHHKVSERTNTSKDNKTDKIKTSSELKRKNMQKKSHTVSHRHVVNDGKTNSILNKVDNANKQLNKSKCSCLDKLDNKVYPRMK